MIFCLLIEQQGSYSSSRLAGGTTETFNKTFSVTKRITLYLLARLHSLKKGLNSSLVQNEDFLPLCLVEDNLLLSLATAAVAYAVVLQMTGGAFANDDSTTATNN